VESHLSKQVNLNKGENHWTLSSNQSATMARYLTERIDISPQRVVPTSFGTHRPRFPTKDEGPRLKNSRLVFSLLPMDTEI
jgi:flagellar motor protein MotB